MIDINLCSEMKEGIPELDISKRVEQNVQVVLSKFLDARFFNDSNILKHIRGFFLEAFAEQGDVDCFDTR